MSEELKPCPHCGAHASPREERRRAGYGEYERDLVFHLVRCDKCGAAGSEYEQKPLIDFTNHTVRDFRNNPALRAKVEDDYAKYIEQTKQLAINAWNTRAGDSDE